MGRDGAVSSQFTGIGVPCTPYGISVTSVARKKGGGWRFRVASCKCLCHKELAASVKNFTIFWNFS